MSRKRRSITSSPEIIESIAERSKMTFDLQTKLVHWLAANEEAQRKFQSIVIAKLCRIEAETSLLLVGQMAEQQVRHPFFYPDQLKVDAKVVDKQVTQTALEEGTSILSYIYKQEPKAEARHSHDRRKKWHGWEI